MRRALAVVVLSLIFVGVAAAGGPLTVTVTRGTLLHGNAASLNAVDGDTLYIEPELDAKYVAEFRANYGRGLSA